MGGGGCPLRTNNRIRDGGKLSIDRNFRSNQRCESECCQNAYAERMVWVGGQAVGKIHTLWVAFAKFYEKHGDIPNARIIFDKAVQVPYKGVDDLAAVRQRTLRLIIYINNL